MKSQKKALKYNKNKPRYSLIPMKALEPAVRAFEYGEHKYSIYEDPITKEQISGKDISLQEVENRNLKRIYSGSKNWRTGEGISREDLLDSTMRHIFEELEGNNLDEESKLYHIGHAISNLIMYSDLYITKENGKTDREITEGD